MILFLAQAIAQPTALPAPTLGSGDLTRGLFAVFVVFGLLGLLAWLARRGSLGGLMRQGRGPIKVEATVPLGDRRSLAIIAVDGRRLLLGMTPMQVSLVAELRAAEPGDATPVGAKPVNAGPFDAALARAVTSSSASSSSLS